MNTAAANQETVSRFRVIDGGGQDAAEPLAAARGEGFAGDPAEATGNTATGETAPSADGQGAGVHPGGPAGAYAGTPARAHTRVTRTGATVKTSLAALAKEAGEELGTPPWKVQPPSLEEAWAEVRVHARQHDPAVKAAYYAWGTVVIMPLTGACYTAWWVVKSPPRTFLALALLAILHRLDPAITSWVPFISQVPGLRDIF